MVDLVEAAGTSRASGGCWAETVSDDIADQLSHVRDMVDRGESVNFAAVQRALGEADVSIVQSSVRRHLRRECKCD